MRAKPIVASVLAPALLWLLFTSAPASADEIRLKDGTKITGTIVGFENDSFRVETSYGFALIRKDKVADINISSTAKDSESKLKSPAPEPSATSATVPAVQPAVAKEPAPSGKSSAAANALAPMHAPASGVPSSAAARGTMPAPAIKSVAAAEPAAPVAPPTPPPAPAPVVIRDEIRGNQYVNETYGFQMFKPPSWELISAARKALPDAVAALGTNDQTTLLVIGRTPAKDSLDAHSAGTEKALREVYENYRLLSNRRVTIAGLPAVEQRSRGSADGRDWSVIAVTLTKGADTYTLLGMTWADSDLIQVQENILAKAVNSLTFSAK